MTAITGQSTMHKWIAEQDTDRRIVAIPIKYVQELGWKTAALLSQMLWWSDQTKNPERKFYRTWKQWMEELSMSEYEVRASIKALEEKGIVRIFCGREPKDKTKKTTWYQVIVEKICHWWKSTLPTLKNHQYPPLKTNVSYIREKKIKEEVKEELAHSANTGTGTINVNSTEVNMAFKESVKGKVVISAAEVSQKLRAKSVDPLKVSKSVGGLNELVLDWKRALAKYHFIDELIPDPKHTERMSLNSFIKKCRVMEVSPRYTLVYVVSEWIGFAKYVQWQRGIANVPAQPTIPFLVYYAEDAIRYVKKNKEVEGQKAKSETNCSGVVTTVNTPAKTMKGKITATVPSATMEEIDQIGKKYFGKG